MATTTRVLTAAVNGTVYTTNANGALEAIDTCHSGSSAPTNEVANGKLWLDTTTTPGILKMYNNAAWEEIGGSTSSPTFTNGTFTGDVYIRDDLWVTGPNPVITLTDTDVADEYGRFWHTSGNNFFPLVMVRQTVSISSTSRPERSCRRRCELTKMDVLVLVL